MQTLSRLWYLLIPAGVIIAAIFAASALWSNINNAPKAQKAATLALLTAEQSAVAAPEMLFVGWGETQTSAESSDLTFIGWGETETSAQAPDLLFVGWGETDKSAEAPDLLFVGWGETETSALAADLLFVGWGEPERAADAPYLFFTGLGAEPFVIDDFNDGAHGWESSDGAEALRVSESGTLCVWDIEKPSTFLTPPNKFLGDWGGAGGELSFRVYYEGTVQWPIVVTLQSPHGKAVRRKILNAYNDKNFQDVSMPIDDIWWEETGDWDSIIRSITSISIEFDIKDGQSEDPEGCIDDFKLVKGHRG